MSPGQCVHRGRRGSLHADPAVNADLTTRLQWQKWLGWHRAGAGCRARGNTPPEVRRPGVQVPQLNVMC